MQGCLSLPQSICDPIGESGLFCERHLYPVRKK
jgi:hypothetical protein